MADFGVANQVAMVQSALIIKNTGIDGSLVSALSEEALNNVVTKIRSAAEVFSNTKGANAMNNQEGAATAKFNQLVSVALNQAIIVASKAGMANLKNGSSQNLIASNTGSADLKNGTSQKLVISNTGSADLKNGTSQKLVVSNTGMATLQNANIKMMSNNAVTETFQNVLNSTKRGRNPFNNTTSDQLSASTFLCNQASEVIRATAAGEKVTLNGNHRPIDK